MAFFDKLGEMTKIVSEKATDSIATNNLVAEINLTKGNIQALQRELGEHYWAKFAVGEQLDDEAMFICDKIVLAHDKIKVLEGQIGRSKQKAKRERQNVLQKKLKRKRQKKRKKLLKRLKKQKKRRKKQVSKDLYAQAVVQTWLKA